MASVGETLRTAREQRGLSIEQVSHDTRISARFLEALEADRFDALPAPVYVRGFIRSYASYLRLDGTALVARLAGEGGGEFAAGGAQAAAEARRVDPFRRQPPPPEANEPVAWPAQYEPPGDGNDGRPQARRRAGSPPGRPLPPPPVPPDARDDLDEDGLVRRRQAPVLGEEAESHSRGRNLALAGIGLLGVAIAIVTAVLLTNGDGGPVATIAPEETPTRSSGTVVVVETRTPTGEATPATGTAAPTGTPVGTPTASPSPTAGGGTAGEPTPTPSGGAVVAPTATPPATATATPTIPLPTATPTFPPTPTSIPTATPTVQPHPFQYQECTVPGATPCGDPPLRVICPPDGTWFVDVGRDYPNPGWPENSTATTTRQAAEVGARGCQ